VIGHSRLKRKSVPRGKRTHQHTHARFWQRAQRALWRKKSGRGGISLLLARFVSPRRFFAKGVVSVNGHGGGSRGPVLAREADPRECKKNWPDPVSERWPESVANARSQFCLCAALARAWMLMVIKGDCCIKTAFCPMAAHAARGYFAGRRRGPNVTGQPVIKSET